MRRVVGKETLCGAPAIQLGSGDRWKALSPKHPPLRANLFKHPIVIDVYLALQDVDGPVVKRIDGHRVYLPRAGLGRERGGTCGDIEHVAPLERSDIKREELAVFRERTTEKGDRG